MKCFFNFRLTPSKPFLLEVTPVSYPRNNSSAYGTKYSGSLLVAGEAMRKIGKVRPCSIRCILRTVPRRSGFVSAYIDAIYRVREISISQI